MEYGSLLIMRQVYYAIVNGQEIAENQEQLLHVNMFQLNKLIVELLQWLLLVLKCFDTMAW